MRVLFFDPFAGGHRVQHVTALLERLPFFKGVEAVFAVHEWVAGQVEKQFDVDEQARIIPLSSQLEQQIKPNNKDVKGGLKCIRVAERLAREFDCSTVHFMHLDTMLPGLAVRSIRRASVDFSGLLFTPTEHYSECFDTALTAKERVFAKAKGGLLRRVLRWPACRRVMTFDTFYPEFLSGSDGAEKLVGVPDLATPPDKAVAPDPVPSWWLKRDFRLLLFGALTRRKGLLVALKALELVDPSLVDRVGLLACGKVGDDIEDELQASLRHLSDLGRGTSVDVVNAFLSDQEIWWLLQRCDAVLMPYQRHLGSSGVLCWAAAARRPAIAQDSGLLGYEVSQWGLGITVDTTDPEAMARGIERCATDHEALAGNPRGQMTYAAQRTQEGFSDAVFRALLQEHAPGYADDQSHGPETADDAQTGIAETSPDRKKREVM